MNIVTICDYNMTDIKYKTILSMFVDSIKENCNTYPYKLWIFSSQPNRTRNLLRSTSSINIVPVQNTNKSVPNNMRNIKSKLYILCNLDFEFIYLDLDMYIASDLAYLWERRKDKPFISTVHQKNIIGAMYGKHVGDDNLFMNSGVQIVSDPKFLDYDNFYNFAVKQNFKFNCSGTDQALLDSYFKEHGYDYTHTDIGCEWNSCAGFGKVNIDKSYNFTINYENGEEKYPVKINHYWHEFKPWLINCPIYDFYKEIYE